MSFLYFNNANSELDRMAPNIINKKVSSEGSCYNLCRVEKIDGAESEIIWLKIFCQLYIGFQRSSDIPKI
jgi:hypothetical protein